MVLPMASRIDELKECDAKIKGADTDREWRLLRRFYDDCSRVETLNALVALGMGIRENVFPVEVPMVRRIIRRLATVYKSPATRWLERANERLPSDDSQQKLLRRVLRRMRANAVWRLADRRRSLFLQCLLRAYPSDRRGGVVLRVFDPYNVIREPSAGEADDIRADKAFAIRVNAGKEAWELWEREGGRWKMSMVNADGELLERQPYDRSQWTPIMGERVDPAPYGGSDEPSEEDAQIPLARENPYDVLPVRMFYAEDPNGQPWIQPRQSRVAAQVCVNAKANDLMSLIRAEAHTDRFIAMKDKDAIPELTGPGTTQTIGVDDKVYESTKSPKITESQDALNNAIKIAFMSEGLPSADMDGAKTILTGAALRVQENELRELREEQLEMVPEDERAIFDIIRAVHNLHAGDWEEEIFAKDVELAVTVGAIDTPQELPIEQAWAHAEIDRGYLHPIEWIGQRDNVDEDEAIRRFQHTSELFKKFPPKPIAMPAPTAMPGRPGNPGGDRAPMDQPKGVPPPQKKALPSAA